MNFLGLKEFDIIRSESNDNGDVVYYLTSTYKPNCPACHSTLCHVHGATSREVRDLNSFGHRVGLIIEGHRYKCLDSNQWLDSSLYLTESVENCYNILKQYIM